MKNEKGITLIELLATITIFSMIVGVSYSMITYVQGSWIHTKGITQTESKVQELQTVLTRELSSPLEITFSGHSLTFKQREGKTINLKLNGNTLTLEKDGTVNHSFSLPVNKIEFHNEKDSAIATLSEGIGYLKIYYSKTGLKSKQENLTLTINVYEGSVIK
ncbi:PulJ/GspJ family protein [Pseudalkalibacillus berkeleyi]|uniref:Prepilin-type N-terminal cleavage/methylation domain-containing protein n=1 Tax=Pseudalkalibacillus berkeleyi TaxID=1069813 RepID=A0ABS9H2Q6_9BACL|nr:prepilin-type N-terminal cleavage/methylation domain-containing protein [Pseudalkalibacillus berkeleyi]MCF6138110.1 prepilin-type N-terminal cleavage/methylation domain-containing protein [Pseudalkalibacillus berkeleyi]